MQRSCTLLTPLFLACPLLHLHPTTARTVQEVLEVAGLPLDSLSSKAQLSASLVASLCSVLGVTRPSLPEFLAAWAQLKLRESRAVVLQVRVGPVGSVACVAVSGCGVG